MKQIVAGMCSLILLLILVPGATSLSASENAPRVVATTPWTAAFALAAGVTEVEVIAPYDLQHPPEYELRATDVGRVQNAELLIYAGYEAMMSRLGSALGDAAPEMLRIRTDHSRSTIRDSVMAIAEQVGTEEAARTNLTEIITFLDDWRAEIDGIDLAEYPVIVHAFHRPILGELGIEPAGVFGPGPLSAGQIAELSQLNPALVVDVWHNQTASPLRETVPEAVFTELINFPGRDGTRTLLDVLHHKRRTLAAALTELR